MNITVKIKGNILSSMYIGEYSMEAEPEESLVSIVDRIDTNMDDFKVISIAFTDEKVPVFQVEVCGDDGFWELVDWLPNSMSYNKADMHAMSLRREQSQGVAPQWARLVEVI